MSLIIEATFDGEVFRPDEKVDLEPDTKVKLELKVKKKKKTGKPYSFIDYARSVNIDAPPDYAENIDDYLYGGKTLDDE
jgi:predicted DNA-binding antitoxin AbrB/MazE fold protein